MCCLSCAKADSCEQADRVEAYCINHEKRPMTNADRLRELSDDEMASFLGKGQAYMEDYPPGAEEYAGAWKWWLGKECKE